MSVGIDQSVSPAPRVPIAARQPAAPRKRTPRQQHPYVKGAFDHLLAPKDHHAPEELSGATIEVTSRGLMLTEHTTAGHHPKHLITSLPHSFDIAGPDGNLYWIEITAIGKHEPPSDTQLARMAAMVGYRTPDEIAAVDLSDLRTPADLLSFSPDE